MVWYTYIYMFVLKEVNARTIPHMWDVALYFWVGSSWRFKNHSALIFKEHPAKWRKSSKV